RRDRQERVTNDFERLPINAQESTYRISHREPCDYRSQQDAAAGRGQNIEVEDRVFRRGLGDYWRNARDKFVQTVNRNLWRGYKIEKRFRLWQAPDEDDDAEDDPGQPGTKCVRSPTVREGAVRRPARMRAIRRRGCLRSHAPDFLRLPEFQKQGEPGDRNDRSYDIDQPRPVKI